MKQDQRAFDSISNPMQVHISKVTSIIYLIYHHEYHEDSFARNGVLLGYLRVYDISVCPSSLETPNISTFDMSKINLKNPGK